MWIDVAMSSCHLYVRKEDYLDRLVDLNNGTAGGADGILNFLFTIFLTKIYRLLLARME